MPNPPKAATSPIRARETTIAKIMVESDRLGGRLGVEVLSAAVDHFMALPEDQRAAAVMHRKFAKD